MENLETSKNIEASFRLPPAAQLPVALPFISPSRYLSMLACPFREVLGRSNAAYLPAHPAAELGNATHKVLELVGKRQFAQEDRVSDVWDNEVRSRETFYAERWFQKHLVPFEDSVPDFYVRRARAIRSIGIVMKSVDQPKVASSATAAFEEGIATADGALRGRVDFIKRFADRMLIGDYKTGPVYDAVADIPVIKPSYQSQLQMYAAMYRENGYALPIELELISSNGDHVQVSDDGRAGKVLLEDARRSLRHINGVLSAASTKGDPVASASSSLASPSKECRFCSWRPICPRAEHTANDSAYDIEGRLEEIRTMQNGTRMVRVTKQNGEARIRSMSAMLGRHPALDTAKPGDRFRFYNVRQAGSPLDFVETPWTTVYMPASIPAQPTQDG